jgi:hypothetical protein
MSLSLDPSLRALDTCGCCEGADHAIQELWNRPGLPAIVRRIGTHSAFKGAALAHLASVDLRALGQLRTRADDDFTIALLDAWSVTADILTFYQERIANESYLRTATETLSLYQLARLVGYRPRPGVAATAHLAFEIEGAGDPDATVPVAPGTRVSSIPGPGEKPQTFETVEPVEARAEWNAIRPRQGRPLPLAPDMPWALLRGLAQIVNAGDPVLIVASAAAADQQKKLIRRVRKDDEAQTTRIDFSDQPLETQSPYQLLTPAVFTTLAQPLSGALIRNAILKASWKQSDLVAQARVQRWPLASVKRNIRTELRSRPIAVRTGIFPLERAAVFGHNAPLFASLPASQQQGGDWDNRTLAADDSDQGFVHLDTVYRGVVPENWVVLETPTQRRVFAIDSVTELSRAAFTLSSKVTRLKLAGATDAILGNFKMRETTVWLARTEPLDLADVPITEAVPEASDPSRIELDGPYVELGSGRTLVLTGERADLDGVVESELLTILEAEVTGGHTWLTLRRPPVHRYKRRSTTLTANVALSTHGEHVRETLGGGDARVAFQRFRLRQPPLTWVSAANPRGVESTLEVWVNDVRYREVERLYDAGPHDRVYSVRTTDDGQTWVEFGDGQTGVRLPTGQENVVATYRKGMGEEGLVRPRQLALLVTRPLGVRGVTNPMGAADAAPAEGLAEVRENAALPLLSLDRVVSLRDYEDFARAFSGIAKALATWTWDGRRRGVFLTVAGARGAEVTPGTQTYLNLSTAIRRASQPGVRVVIATYRSAFFQVKAKVKVDPSFHTATVLAAVDATLHAAFAFERRAFGQPVSTSEIALIVHAVPGVVAVDIDALFRPGEAELPNPVVTADLPQSGIAEPLAAQLLLLDPRPVALGVMS